jgi:hypothetical protein
MALEHLFKDLIIDGKVLVRHPESTHLKCRSGYCSQFKVNPAPANKMIEIPQGTSYFRFKEYAIHGNFGIKMRHIDYGFIEFYREKGNLLDVHKT